MPALARSRSVAPPGWSRRLVPPAALSAGILGPLIVNAIADAQKSAGHSGPELYTTSFFLMIGLLAVGFAANELVRPVHPRHHEPPTPGAPSAAGTATPKGAEQ
jgi:hypothetical protein